MSRFCLAAAVSVAAALSGSGASVAAPGTKQGPSGPSPKQTALAECLEANGASVNAASLNHGYLASRRGDQTLIAALRACRGIAGVPDPGLVVPPGAAKPGA